MKIDLEKEPPIVRMAYLTAKGASELGDAELIKDLADSLARHSVKAMLKIKTLQEAK